MVVLCKAGDSLGHKVSFLVATLIPVVVVVVVVVGRARRRRPARGRPNAISNATFWTRKKRMQTLYFNGALVPTEIFL